MPECFKVVCISCKALYKCSDLPFTYLYQNTNLTVMLILMVSPSLKARSNFGPASNDDADKSPMVSAAEELSSVITATSRFTRLQRLTLIIHGYSLIFLHTAIYTPMDLNSSTHLNNNTISS